MKKKIEYRKLSIWREVYMDYKVLPNMGYCFSPEFMLLFSYRVQNRLRNIPVLGSIFAKVLGIITTIFTACDISSNARLEGGIIIVHAIGIVIGPKVIIKSGTRILHQVTIGGKFGEMPVIDNNANIYVGAKILGNITIGKNASIGANAVVLNSVPDNALAVGVPAKLKISKRIL